jgi:hypothetical protein
VSEPQFFHLDGFLSDVERTLVGVLTRIKEPPTPTLPINLFIPKGALMAPTEDKHPELGFKFKIGEVVTHTAFDLGEAARKKGLKIQRMLICTRLIDECAGGVQRHYLVRSIVEEYGRHGVAIDLLKLGELELVAVPTETPAP